MIRLLLLRLTLAAFTLTCPNPAVSQNEEAANREIVVGVFDSLIPSENIRRSRVSLEQLVKLVGGEVRYPTRVRVVPGGTPNAIRRAAAELQSGSLDLVAVTGLEYGWVRNDLRVPVDPLVISSQVGPIITDESLVVEVGKDFNDLNRVQLATYPSTRPAAAIYIAQLRLEYGAQALPAANRNFANGAQALLAVAAGQADAAIVDLYTLARLEKANPPAAKRLQVLRRSGPLPMPVVIGLRDVIDARRPGLWRDFQATLLAVHGDKRAEAFREVWGVVRFVPHSPDYEKLALDASRAFPFNAPR